MQHLYHSAYRGRRRISLLSLGLIGVWSLSSVGNVSAGDAPALPKAQAKSYGTPGARSALVSPEGWDKAEKIPLRAGEIDQLIATELRNDKIAPAPLTTAEEFLRRVSLDLTGQLPLPADVD